MSVGRLSGSTEGPVPPMVVLTETDPAAVHLISTAHRRHVVLPRRGLSTSSGSPLRTPPPPGQAHSAVISMSSGLAAIDVEDLACDEFRPF